MESILIVDDDPDLRQSLRSFLEEEGFRVITAEDGKKALRMVKRKSPDLVLLDVKLPDRDGMEILGEAKKIDKDLVVIMLTAYGEVKQAVEAMKLGAFHYVTKPFNIDELTITIRKGLETQYLSREIKSLKERLDERFAIEKITGGSQKIRRVLNQVKTVALTNMTVVIQGESGTGKEFIAQIIHQNSARKERPFMAVDCGAIPETLIESELFGYEKGAFTGADSRREGKFEQAHSGTLFLDEITNLSESAQMKFLRVIQERKLQRLGGSNFVNVDVRIIVATNCDMAETVRKKRFRKDLFFRLSEFSIDLPPLRERREDIPILASCFLKEANEEIGKDVKGIANEAGKRLMNYSWPGNVRELRNVVRKAVLLSESRLITPDNIFFTEMEEPEDLFDLGARINEEASFEEIVGEVQKRLIKKALQQASGNKTKAAEILKMNRKALYRRMEYLKL